MRTLAFGSWPARALPLGSLPAVAQSTTRIEPRPFYGATVTLEEGVRVFRPLPPHDRVIINPGNATPLYLNVGGVGATAGYYLDGYAPLDPIGSRRSAGKPRAATAPGFRACGGRASR